jgi:hypothetical protein
MAINNRGICRLFFGCSVFVVVVMGFAQAFLQPTTTTTTTSRKSQNHPRQAFLFSSLPNKRSPEEYHPHDDDSSSSSTTTTITDGDDYSPQVTGGCVKDIANHIRLLDQS